MNYSDQNDISGISETKTRWMKFEDWFWYRNHTVIEYTSHQVVKCAQKNKLGLWIRRVLFLCSCAPILIGIVNDGIWAVTTYWMYMTYWGKNSTWLALLLGSFMYNE